MIKFNNGLMAPEIESLDPKDVVDCMLVTTSDGRRFMKVTAKTGRRYLIHELNNPHFDSIRIKIENREDGVD